MISAIKLIVFSSKIIKPVNKTNTLKSKTRPSVRKLKSSKPN